MKVNRILLAVVTSLFVIHGVADHIHEKKVPKKKQTGLHLYTDAKEAYSFMKHESDKTLFIDVRTRGEVNFLGMPTVADANIPYMMMNEWYEWNPKKDSFKLEVNQKFVPAIEERLKQKGLTKKDRVILMCRSGKRSAKAADLLGKSGFKNVYTVIEGFEGDKAKKGDMRGKRVVNGWRNAGLPWTYKLDKSKMYFVQN